MLVACIGNLLARLRGFVNSDSKGIILSFQGRVDLVQALRPLRPLRVVEAIGIGVGGQVDLNAFVDCATHTIAHRESIGHCNKMPRPDVNCDVSIVVHSVDAVLDQEKVM